MDGSGRILVVGVGAGSVCGRMRVSARGHSPQTPLQEKLSLLSKRVGRAEIVLAVVLLLLLCVKQGLAVSLYGQPFSFRGASGVRWRRAS